MTDPAGLERLPCPLCGGKTAALPAPHPNQSMLSDARIVRQALRKRSCFQCGAAFHATATSEADIRAIYGRGYSLAGSAPRADAARADAYCRWIQTECGPPRSILEIGCGSGALLRELLVKWPLANGYGIDPAYPESGRSDSRLRLERAFIEDIPVEVGNFDLIVAINVIEHTSSPGQFLASLRSRLAPGGKVVIVCPSAQPANVELLFFDHRFTLTAEALDAASRATPLGGAKRSLAPSEIGDFQMIVFDTGDPARVWSAPRHQTFSELCAARQSYLEGWRKLDQTLLDRSPPVARLVAFGGGQTAALLRAYAPRTWARVALIVLDDANESWTLGPPIASYRNEVQNLAAAKVLIATSPRTQNAIADRLRADGIQSIAWNDLVPN